MVRVALTVNGMEHTVEADADTPLLWVLRDLIGLTGTKYGCGVGICGACTVLTGDRAVRSCQVPLSRAAGGTFTTIEGSPPVAQDPIRQAWLEEDVAQCGYCQPGMIATARALLTRVPAPTDDQIDEAFGAMVCRCGSYSRVRRAIHRAARAGGAG
jgi:isoquinoline 1-oxidoreductase alpha subunit